MSAMIVMAEEMIVTAGCIIVWHLIVSIMQSFTRWSGSKAARIPAGIRARESPSFTFEFAIQR